MKRGGIISGAAPGGKGDENREMGPGVDGPGQFAFFCSGGDFCPVDKGQSAED